jgi:WD40 repeat protein
LKTLSLSDADVPPLLPAIRSVHCILDAQGTLSTVVTSTASAEIYEAFFLSGRVQLLNEAHFDGELHAMATHPKSPDIFMTAGDDCTLRIWTISERRLLRKAVLDCTVRACCWSPDGKTIVVGMGGKADGQRQRKDGAFLVLDGNTLKPRYEGRYGP